MSAAKKSAGSLFQSSKRKEGRRRRHRRNRLGMEQLERRCLLEADMLGVIAGTVFNDTNDDGVFNAGIDIPLEGVEVSLTREESGNPTVEIIETDALGQYEFDMLSAGTYLVTQAPVAGLVQRPGVSQQVVVKSTEDATGVSGLTIDSFETQVGVFAFSEQTPDTDFVQTSSAEVIGGERELFASLTSNSGFVDMTVNPSGSNPVLQFDSAAASTGERNVIWDGSSDNGNPGLDFDLNEDLTVGGADSLVVRVAFDDLPFDLTVRVYSGTTDDNFLETTINLPGSIFSETEAFVVPFDQFTQEGNGADFSNVTAIELLQTDPTAPSVDMQIEYIGTIGPMQVDFPNLQLGIQLEKSTAGFDADTPTGPLIPVGDLVDFQYEVSNTGNVVLGIDAIVDDNGTPFDPTDDFTPNPVEENGFNIGDTNENGLLDLTEDWFYEANRIVTPGQYTNIAVVGALGVEDAGEVSDQDPSNHFGVASDVLIEKETEGEDADDPTGPLIAVGELADFTYNVSNPGNVALTIQSVIDDNGTPGDESDDFEPNPILSDGFNIGDTNQNDFLDTDEIWRYEADRIVTPGQYTNIALVTTTDLLEQIRIDTDSSNHFGVVSAVLIEKETEGEDADDPTGPLIPVGEFADFTYAVSNPGNVALTIQSVIDDNGTPGDESDDFEPNPILSDGFNIGDDNQNDLLDTDEIWRYEADRIVTPGQYTNIALVTVLDPIDQIRIDTDSSNHFGVLSAVLIEKETEGEDADDPTGPLIAVGEFADFTYAVSNPGNVPLTIQSVIDDNGTPGDESDDFEPNPILSDGFNIGDTNQNDLLDTDEIWRYEADRIVTPGQYTNIALVTTLDLFEQIRIDTDSSNHFGVASDVLIEKETEGEDADDPTGPLIPVGDFADFTYAVSNPGNVALTIQSVVDDNGTPGDESDDFEPNPILSDGFNIGDDNQNDLLDTDEIWRYEADRIVTPGQYTNIALVTVLDPIDQIRIDTDSSNHFGVLSAVLIEKETEGEDADDPTGPLIAVGEFADFTYAVSNPGNVPLTIQSVIDDNGTPGDESDDFEPNPILSDGFNIGDTNQNDLLDTDEIWRYEADRIVTPGQYTNIALVTTLDLFEQIRIDTDSSNHFGVVSDVLIEKETEGEDADDPTGPLIPVGEFADFTYAVSNLGNVALTIQSVIDDNGTPGDESDDFEPNPILSDGFNIGDTNQNDLLDTDEIWRYEADRIVTPGQYTNIALVTVLDPIDQIRIDTDSSNHFGVASAVLIEKETEGEDADDPTGPLIPVGEFADFTYAVSNPGNVALTIQSVIDDNGTPGDESDDFEPNPILSDGFNIGDDNQNDLLDTDEIWRYEADRIVTPGQYTNIALVTTLDPIEQIRIDTDSSNHFGVASAVLIEKETEGEDADVPTGPLIAVGEFADFTYNVSNPGNVALTITSVIDDNGTPGDESDDFEPNPILSDGFNIGDTNQNDLLDTDEIWRYEADRIVTPGQYTNIALVTTLDPIEQIRIDTDSSNHFGVASAVLIEKETEGEDADVPLGPILSIGSLADFTYNVSNPGNIAVDIITVIDDNGTPVDPSDDFEPNPILSDGFNIGDTNQNDLLDTDEIWRYEADRIVTAGQYTNTAVVTVQDPIDQIRIDADQSNHYGVTPNPDPAILIEKETNGFDADTPTGPLILINEFVDFDYSVSNAGNIPLIIDSLIDDGGTPDDPGDDFSPDPILVNGFNIGDVNEDGLLDTTEIWRYDADRIVTSGQYTNIAKVIANDLLDEMVMDLDPSNHYGVDPELLEDFVVIGNDKGPDSFPFVTVIDPDPGLDFQQFLAYESSYRGGVRVAVGDMNGDGLTDIITAPGKGHEPEIRVFSRDLLIGPDVWVELTEYRTLAYDVDFVGGVNIAVADIDGDGLNDIVTTPGRGAEQTKVFRNTGNSENPILNVPYREFYAFDSDFISGSVVTTADMNLDGLPEVIVGNVGGLRSTVLVYDVESEPEIINAYFPFDDDFRGGVSLDFGEVTPDDVPDLIVGASYRGHSEVELINGDTGELLTDFVAYSGSTQNAPVRAVFQKDGLIDRVITVQGPNGEVNQIRSFNIEFGEGGWFADFDPLFTIDLDEFENPFLQGAYYIDAKLYDLVELEPDDTGAEPESMPQDVNEDGSVSALDALIVINDLSRQSLAEGEFIAGVSGVYNTDVNRDNQVTALDALQIINYLGREDSNGAEAEFVPTVPSFVDQDAVDSAYADATTEELTGDAAERLAVESAPSTDADAGTSFVPASPDDYEDEQGDETLLRLLADDQLAMGV